MLQSADDEATRQSDEKRAALAQHLADAEARADADLAAMLEQKNTTASEDGTGGDDLVAPSTGLVTVTVIGPPGLRRAGFQFGAEPQSVAVTPDQKAIIEADPLLVIAVGGSASGAQRASALARLAIDDFEFASDVKIDVTVLGPTKGRRRAGFSFTDAAQTVSVTKEQLTLLLEDEELAVQPA